MSTARCYLDPVRKPPQPAHRDRRTDRGAAARRQALHRRALFGRRRARARRAPRARSWSAPASINSPQLLELSGIGQPERLRDLGIEVRHALPGVGENLRDHYAPRTRWPIGTKGITFNDRGRGLGLVHQALRYALFRQGPARHGRRRRCAPSSARAKGWRRRTCCSGWVPMLTEPGPKGPRIVAPVRLDLLRPSDAARRARATSTSPSADPRQPPAINFNFLSSPRRRRADRARRSASPARS